MLQDLPYIVDPIGDMQDLAMSMYRREFERHSVLKKIQTLSNIDGAKENLEYLSSTELRSIVKYIGFGVNPSNFIAVLDLLKRNNETWETMLSWLDIPERAPALKPFSDSFYSSTVEPLISDHLAEISNFHLHQDVRRYHTKYISSTFMYLFFRQYRDKAPLILRKWNQNTETTSLYDLVRLADNFTKLSYYPADWIFSIIGVTKHSSKGQSST